MVPDLVIPRTPDGRSRDPPRIRWPRPARPRAAGSGGLTRRAPLPGTHRLESDVVPGTGGARDPPRNRWPRPRRPRPAARTADPSAPVTTGAPRDDRVGLSAMAYTSLLDRLGLHRRELRAWALYDVANSAWMTTVHDRRLPALLREGRGRRASPREVARSRFAFATSLSVILVGLLGPLLGAIADYRGSKKLFLRRLPRPRRRRHRRHVLHREGQWAFALATFVVGNVARHLHPGLLQLAAPVDRVRRARWTASRPPASPWATSAAASSSPSTWPCSGTRSASASRTAAPRPGCRS